MKELQIIQGALKAPKGQTNKFGGYKYRSCEDILELVKPLLQANNCYLTLNDELVLVGDRYYIKATASLHSEKEIIKTSAYAREELTKKGMDASQITGTASSYARKYALNGLFCIDDTKDADTMPPKEEEISTKRNIPVCDLPYFDVAMSELKAATKKEDLKPIYERYPTLQSNKDFISCMASRKKDFTNAK